MISFIIKKFEHVTRNILDRRGKILSFAQQQGFDISRRNYFVCPRSCKIFKRSLKVILAHNVWWSCRTFQGNGGFRGSLN